MRLPEDRTERIKILALVGLGSVAVIFMVVSLLVKPLLSKKAERREQITALTEKLEAAEADVGRMIAERDGNIAALEKIVGISRRQGCILEPRLGNYELGAHEFVEATAKEAGVTVTSVQELGITLLPQAAESKKERALKCYGLHVNLHVGLHGLHRFLSVIEIQNPYVVVSGLTIAARANEAAEHEVGIDLQWPIWTDPTRSRQLEQRLQECQVAMQAPAKSTPGD